MKIILILVAIYATLWLLFKVSDIRSRQKREEQERRLTFDANHALHHLDKYLEQGELKNGWARVKLAERRFAYIRPDGKGYIHMTPDYNYCVRRYDGHITGIINQDNPNSNIFEEAEEFNYPSAIVKRKDQEALLGSNSQYLVPFESPILGRRTRSAFRDLGNGLLEYWKTVFDGETSHTIESTHSVYNRSGKMLFEGDFKKAFLEKGKLILLTVPTFREEERIVVDPNTGQVLIPEHLAAYELENGKLLFYTRRLGSSGWNVYDCAHQVTVFNNTHGGIVYLEKRNVYVLVDELKLSIADEKGQIVRELPRYVNTIYAQRYFSGSHHVLSLEGNTIVELADGSISVIESHEELDSSVIEFWSTDYLQKQIVPPYRKTNQGKILYLNIYNYENHTFSIVDLNGNTIIGPISNRIEPNYSLDNKELIGFKIRSGAKKWQLYSLSGDYLDDEIEYNHFEENDFNQYYYDSIMDIIDIRETPIDDDVALYDLYGDPSEEYYPVYRSRKSSVSSLKSAMQPEVKPYSYYLFFDTETTGLPKNYNAPVTHLDNWPRLVQLSWIVTDSKGAEQKVKDYIIKPDGFTIPEEASKMHGVTTTIAEQEGCQLKFVLEEFLSDLDSVGVIIGHNVEFDKKIVGAEFVRCNIDRKSLDKPTVCTMKSSVEYCKLPGKFGNKWPTLQELHQKLFDADFMDAHNSLNDIRATKKCFFELRARGIV